MVISIELDWEEEEQNRGRRRKGEEENGEEKENGGKGEEKMEERDLTIRWREKERGRAENEVGCKN